MALWDTETNWSSSCTCDMEHGLTAGIAQLIDSWNMDLDANIVLKRVFGSVVWTLRW